MMKNIIGLFLVSILVVGCMGAGGRGGNGHGRGHGNGNGGGLKMNFYGKLCRLDRLVTVESTVRQIVWSKVSADPSMAAKLLRLHYHDCFVRVSHLLLHLTSFLCGEVLDIIP